MVMATDSLNRRTGGDSKTRRVEAVARGKTNASDARKQQQKERILQQSIDEERTRTTQSDVLQGLRDAMPKMLLRFFCTTAVFAFAAIIAYVPTLQSASVDSNDGLLLMTSVKSAGASLRDRKVVATPTVDVLATYPHDPEAFTQGLVVAKQGSDKFFIESTGLYGQSTLRKVAIESGRVLDKYDLPEELFGEGVTLSENGEVVMITWKSRKGLVFQTGRSDGDDARTFSFAREFEFKTVTGEGWGIDSDGSHLIVTDGSSSIMFWDPKTMQEVRRIDVHFQNRPISQLNEIEFANGFIYANIWFQTVIVKIDPQSGEVVSVFDCTHLADPAVTQGNHNAVLNGIAYDGDDDAFYVTGKLWNAVYKVRLLD